jgi:hypothetical protein
VAAVAGALHVAASAVHTRVTTDNSNAPECVFAVGRLRLGVSVSSEPQAYAVLERQAEEEAQIFGGKRITPAPSHVPHLGIDAYWFPQEEELLTTDGVHLITARFLSWPGVGQRRWPPLAAAAARPYLGRLRVSLARGPAPGAVAPSTTSTSS